jgi:hypothetical protein
MDSRQSPARIDKYGQEDCSLHFVQFAAGLASFDGVSRTRSEIQSFDRSFLESAMQPRTSPAQPVFLP